MLQINVALPNGHAELQSLLPSSTVQDVRTKAQLAFGKKYLRLITAKNRVLANPEQTLEEAEIKDGECLTALVLQPQVAATNGAFALWCHGDSAIVTWGSAFCGGDSLAVQDQLKGVQQIQAAYSAFAAILEDGSVVTWGDAGCGGDSSAVRYQLKGVQQIQATQKAFAAILEDGSVVTWGDAADGGDKKVALEKAKFFGSTPDLRNCELQVPSISHKSFCRSIARTSNTSAKSSCEHCFELAIRSFSCPGCCQSALNAGAVTVWQFRISSRVCSRFTPHIAPLLRFWKMDRSLLGVMQAVVVTVRQFDIS